MKTQKAICSIRNPQDGNHDLTDLNIALAHDWNVVQMISDCQSAIVYILEQSSDDEPQQKEQEGRG